VKSNILLYVLLFGINSQMISQENTFEIVPVLEANPLVLDQQIYLASIGDSLMITQCKFYLSQLIFESIAEEIYTPKKKHHLLDVNQRESLSISLPTGFEVKNVSFSIGVDSLVNVAGAQPGDLDPMHGMYWAWNTGYINFKLEGQSPVCERRKNKFQWHIGGFQAPYNTQRKVAIKNNPTQNNQLILDLSKLIASIDLKTEHAIMSPNVKAVLLANQLTQIFYWNE